MGLFDSALVGTVTSTGSVTEKKNSVIEKKSSATDEKKLSNRKKKDRLSGWNGWSLSLSK